MLRSLWSGMSGLGVHQQALDVEANNIANVNTTGFKYSRVSFQDLLSQTGRVSSAGGENIGGTNAVQVGLGVKLASVERIFKQGSIQQTDKVTDLALQGDGFFVVDAYGNGEQSYTRAGNFHLDSDGFLVDGNGSRVQGWEADQDYHINTNGRINAIQIEPSMVLPAEGTEVLEVQANLNASNEIVESIRPTNTADIDADIASLYNARGEQFVFDEGDAIVIETVDPTNPAATITTTLHYPSTITSMRDIQDAINSAIKDPVGEQVNRVNFDGAGRLVDIDHWISSITVPNQPLFEEIFAGFPTFEVSETVKSNYNSLVFSDNMQELFDENGKKIDLQNGQGITVEIEGLNETRKFIYKEVEGVDSCLTRPGEFQDPSNIELATDQLGMHWGMNSLGEPMNFNIGDSIDVDFSDNLGGTVTRTFEYGINFSTIDDLCCKLNEFSPDVNNAKMTFANGMINQTDTLAVGPWIQNITFNSGDPINRPAVALPGFENGFSRMVDTLDNLIGGGAASEEIYQNDIYYFNTMNDLQNVLQLAVDQAGDPLNSLSTDLVTPTQIGNVGLNDNGQIVIENVGSKTFDVKIGGYPDNATENTSFTSVMASLSGLSVPENTSSTRVMKSAYHIVSTDVYDDFGSSYVFDMHFKKMSSENEDGKIVWGFSADIAEPASITSTPQGEIVFNGDGSLHSYTPPSITFTPNSGLNNTPVTMNLDFGSYGMFDGVVSQNGASETKRIQQDGYGTGRLEDIAVSGEGIISGIFSNGMSKSLSQVAIARFKNNEGLESLGNNMYKASANSGEPWILEAGSAGTGTVQSNSIERSNVDLSRSLIEMIVFQRGFQANSKTISTADEILKALLDLKR